MRSNSGEAVQERESPNPNNPIFESAVVTYVEGLRGDVKQCNANFPN